MTVAGTGQPIAGGNISRLFDSPLVIGTAEGGVDLADIGNGRGELIDQSVEELIERAAKAPEARSEDFAAPLSDLPS
jgi:hypothetical protein